MVTVFGLDGAAARTWLVALGGSEDSHHFVGVMTSTYQIGHESHWPVDVLEDVGTVEPRAVVVTLAVDVGVGECVGVLVPTMYWMRLFPCV